MRILAADDFPGMLEAVERVLAPEYEIVGKVQDGLALVECAFRLRPDLLVTDLSMPKLNGIGILRRLRGMKLEIPVIVFTVHEDEELENEVFSAGAQGFVLKSRLASDLPFAVREVFAGRTFSSVTSPKRLPGTGDQANIAGRQSASEILLDRSGLLIERTESMSWKAGRTPGCWSKLLFVEEQDQIATSLVRMDAGAHFPAHRHLGPEELLVLEGDLVIESRKMRPGDYCRAKKGSVHSASYTESGCLCFLKASQLDEILE